LALAGAAAAGDSMPSPARPIRILLCDEQALFRAGVRALLRERTGLEVVGEAADGPTAVDAVERLRPDVAIMDVEMPLLNGVEATRRIAAAHPEVKVLILTRHDDVDLTARCLEAGARGYLLKDVPVSQLAFALHAVATGGRYLSRAALEHVLDGHGRPIGPARTRYDLLTPREREVLKLLADGLSSKEIASRLRRSVRTVEVHKYNLMRKLAVHDRGELVRFAIAHRVIQVPDLALMAGGA